MAAARLDGAQWDRIARQAGGRHSSGDCRCHWASNLAANREPWTPNEDAAMSRIAQLHGSYNVRRLSLSFEQVACAPLACTVF